LRQRHFEAGKTDAHLEAVAGTGNGVSQAGRDGGGLGVHDLADGHFYAGAGGGGGILAKGLVLCQQMLHVRRARAGEA